MLIKLIIMPIKIEAKIIFASHSFLKIMLKYLLEYKIIIIAPNKKDKDVEKAAPIIPNFGIHQKFKTIFKRAIKIQIELSNLIFFNTFKRVLKQTNMP